MTRQIKEITVKATECNAAKQADFLYLLMLLPGYFWSSFCDSYPAISILYANKLGKSVCHATAIIQGVLKMYLHYLY